MRWLIFLDSAKIDICLFNGDLIWKGVDGLICFPDWDYSKFKIVYNKKEWVGRVSSIMIFIAKKHNLGYKIYVIIHELIHYLLYFFNKDLSFHRAYDGLCLKFIKLLKIKTK